MALRRASPPIKVKNWLGLQTFGSAENIGPAWWIDSSNIIVTNDGSAAVLRSPANFNTATANSNPVLSAFDYDKQSGNLILWDEQIGAAGASSVRTYSTSGGGNTTVRSSQAEARWKRLTINDMAYSVNGSEFIQTDGTNTYLVGITAPASAPTVSFVAGGSGSLAVGVTVAYAYRNSTTKHVSAPSTASSNTGASAGSLTLRIAVTASTQTGVDGIVLYITADGGSIRYLYIDTSGDPVINSNSTGNIDISLALLTNLDTLTPETAFNTVPPQTAFFMFKGRNDRLYLVDFRGAITRQQVQYNIFENCYYGIPWESWDSRNIINIPNKADAARSGIATDIGDLILGEQDAYLIRGSPTDKVSGPEGAVSITEHMQSLNWSIGTRSPYTLVSTQFGAMWLDQNKRIQLWPKGAGFPVEVGLPIRLSLDAILDTDAGRNMAEATWYQHGADGGQFVLTASTTGTTNNKVFFISIYRDPEDNSLHFACAISDIAAQCLMVAKVSGTKRFFIGVTDRLRDLLDLDLAGAGWGSTQSRYFKTVIGNDSEFCYWSDLRIDATSVSGLTITIANMDGTETQYAELDTDTGQGGAYYYKLDAYGFRKVLTFTFSSSDSVKRVIKNMRVTYKETARRI